MVLDGGDEAPHGDEEEEDAAGGDAADDGQRLHHVALLAVGRHPDQDERQ